MKRGPWRVIRVENTGKWHILEYIDGFWASLAECYNADDADMIARNLNETVWGEAYPEVPGEVQ